MAERPRSAGVVLVGALSGRLKLPIIDPVADRS